MISFSVNVTDQGSQAIRNLVRGLSPRERQQFNEAGGRGAVVAAQKYHREFDKAGGWRGPNYLGTGSGQGSDFGSDIARGWFFRQADKDGATIANNARNYAFKVHGGTIIPKRAKALTIPLVAEARGLSALRYEETFGEDLFIPRGKSVLAVKSGRGFRSIFALVRSVTMQPWPGAVPPEEVIGSAFAEHFREALADYIERGGDK